MAAKEELYAKVTPRRQRQSRPSTVKHGTSLDVLLSMGFPKTRALKALVSTGGKNVQAACDWLFSHVDDPFLDDPLPREYVLYMRPSGVLLQQLSHFWQQSRATVAKWKGLIPMPLPLELYTSSTFIGLFVEEQMAEVLKTFALDFATEATAKADVHVEPHKKQLHVTLAYHFQASHLPNLEKLAKTVEVSSGCDWLAVLYSRDIRFANHENDDELELAQGDFIFMSPVEQSSASEGWVFGTSLGTGLSGLLPENYVNRADESDTWVVHGSHSVLTSASPSNSGSTVAGSLFDGQLNDSLFDTFMDPPGLTGLCPPMQMRLFVCRHGERMDVVFGKNWVSQCFDAKGRYIRSNLNMPSSLPTRSGSYRDYDKDCPITVFGSTQARLVGEALLESHTGIDFVYCSPSLRCVQTAQNILQGLQQEAKTKIRVEPGLFEWTKHKFTRVDPPAELAAANLNVDTTYRPHIPVSKLTVSESYDTYISRSFQVTREILTDSKNLGNTVLIVAHASSLEACTRQIQGLSPQNSKDFIQVVRKIPYLGFCACEELGETGVWQLVDPPILPLTHGPNHSFNWREMLMQD
ncbi:hypothetical protein F7725_006587 [Dissostichus mawsoni]|uniref:UBA domain-containing protein n=1 Tax=Dissostichus mawsoni TaxID=36200 RepID=A0A7J5XUC2_DISMA|nr:hypothetical protein F7725_006587 [Dissostichus mawsoni]